MTHSAIGVVSPSEIRRHWSPIAGCFLTAVFAWGFGFYGQSVYLSEPHRLCRWSSFLIGSATTTFYLSGALLVTRVHLMIDRFGPRVVLLTGSALLGFGAFLFCSSTAPLRLYGAGLVMACGWACTTMAAISTVLEWWFDRQLGLAISLALNGASAAGFIVTPVLSVLSQRYGLVGAVAATALALLALLVLVMFGMDPLAPRGSAPALYETRADPRPAYEHFSEAFRDWHLWSVALPFALVLVAQVGFLVHLVALLRPQLGPDGAASAVAAAAIFAMLGRIGLGFVIDRLDQRRVSAASFASQALGLLAILVFPSRPEVLYGGCCLFGLSVGQRHHFAFADHPARVCRTVLRADGRAKRWHWPGHVCVWAGIARIDPRPCRQLCACAHSVHRAGTRRSRNCHEPSASEMNTSGRFCGLTGGHSKAFDDHANRADRMP